MLGKLFKHEWKTASKMLLLVHAFVLLFAVLSRIYLEICGGLNAISDMNSAASIVAFTMILLMVFGIISAAFFTYVYVAYRFYKNVFTDQGYLTNTLPVTPMQIIVSKGLVGVIWSVIDMIVLSAALMILIADGRVFADIIDFLGHIPYDSMMFWLVLISMILSPFIMALQGYFCVAVGNLFGGHKVLGAIGVFIGTYTVEQIISIVIMAFTGYQLFNTSHTSTNVEIGIQTMMDSLNSTVIVSLIFSILCAAVFWFVTKYIVTKKLNLQ